MTIIADTPDKIRLFQLITVKHSIGLEAKGLRHSRFRCGLRGLWAKHYGMSPRSKPEAVIARVQQDIDALVTKIDHDNQMELPL